MKSRSQEQQESRAVARKPRDVAAVLFGLKFADSIHYKFKNSQASKARLQSFKHRASSNVLTTWQNVTYSGQNRSRSRAILNTSTWHDFDIMKKNITKLTKETAKVISIRAQRYNDRIIIISIISATAHSNRPQSIVLLTSHTAACCVHGHTVVAGNRSKQRRFLLC